MKGKQAVVCPSCGALNRPNWEFCARCNESLQDAPAAEGPVAVPTDERAASPVSTSPANATAVIGLLAVLVLGVAAWRHAANAPPPEGPDPALFKMATRPPELPSPPPAEVAGAADYEAGMRLLHAGDLDGAIAKLAAAIAADPQDAQYRSAYAQALLRNGDQDGAIAAQAEAARLDPRYQLLYASSLDFAGRTAEAREQYEAILARGGGAAVEEGLGRLLFRSGDYARAAPHLKEAAEARPNDPVLQQELAYALDRAGDKAQALALYRDVLKKAPGAVISRGLLAEGLYEQGRKDEALSVLAEGLKATPDAPSLQRTLGSVLERSGRPSEAAAAYRSYARLAPNAPDARDIAARAARLEAAGRTP